MIDNNLKKYKSLYLLVSGGTDSALGLFLIAKYINDNKVKNENLFQKRKNIILNQIRLL